MCYIYFCILVDIGIKINKICTSYGKRNSVIRIGGTKGMTITEKLNQQGFKVSEPRYLSDDEVHLSIVGKPSFTKLETANWLYNQTQPISKESLIESFGVVLHKDTALTGKLVENWKKVRKVTYRNLRYFEKAVYISKEYGVIRVIDHTESPSRIVEQLEDRVMTGESKEDLSWMDSEDFIALYVDEFDGVRISFKSGNLYKTFPCLGKYINEKERAGELNLEGFRERGGIIHNDRYYLLHVNKDGEYYIVRYKKFDKQ